MNHYKKKIVIAVLVCMLSGCGSVEVGKGYFSGQTKPTATEALTFAAQKSQEALFTPVGYLGYDLQCADLRDIDFETVNTKEFDWNILYDSRTLWPDHVVDGFDPKSLLESSKKPGYHLAQVHAQGITGKQVRIGVIGQPVLFQHEELKDAVKMYKSNVSYYKADQTNTWGLSFMVGKEVGVAPDAEVYYIADYLDRIIDNDQTFYDVSSYANDIYEMIEVNKTFAEDEKIRILLLPVYAISEQVKGGEEVRKAILEAVCQGMIVLGNDVNQYNGYGILKRNTSLDVDDLSAYDPNLRTPFVTEIGERNHILLAPICCKTLASSIGVDDYAYFSSYGGDMLKFYLAGLYALALQVNPELTKADIEQILYQTGVALERDGLDPIPMIDPLAFIEYIKEMEIH